MAVMLLCSTDGEDAELVNALLLESDATAIVEYIVSDDPNRSWVELTAGFDNDVAARKAMTRIGALADCSIGEADDSWVESQRLGIHPQRIGPWFVRAPWHDGREHPDDQTAQGSSIELIIDPGAAFGHGSHPTTAMMLRLLPDVVSKGADVIDVGTGTGVLAIAAAKLGANVIAVDIDPVAIACAEDNSGRNLTNHQIDFRLVDAAELPRFEVDVAVAFSNMTIFGQAQVASALQSVQTIVLSGLLDTQIDAAIGLYPEHRVTTAAESGEWVALVLRG